MNRHIAQGTAASVVYMATTVTISVLQLKILLRALPPEIVGLWLLFLAIGAYVLFFDLGISPTVAREISFTMALPHLNAEERTAKIGELLTTMRQVFRTTAACVGVLGTVAGEFLIHISPRYHAVRSISWAWAIFNIGASVNLLGSTAFAGLFGIGNIAAEKVVRSVCLILGFGLTITALRLHAGILGLAIAWCVQALLTQMFAWRQLRCHMPDFFRRSYSLNWAIARRLAAPCINMAVVQLGTLLILQSANILIALLIDTRAIPSYEAVSKISLTLMTLALLIVNSSTPYLSMAHAAGDQSKFRGLLLYNLRFGLGAMMVLCAFVAVNGDHIISIWLGKEVFAGFPVVWALLLTSLLEVHHVIFATAVLASGRIAFIYAALLAGILNVLLAVLLAARFGLLGIAIAIAAAQILTNNWYAPYLAIKIFHLSIKELFQEVWLPVTGLLIVQVAFNVCLRQIPWLATDRFLNLAVNLFLSLCLGVVICSVFLLGAAERKFIMELLPSRRRPSVEQ